MPKSRTKHIFSHFTSAIQLVETIVKILNLYMILSCTHLYHFFPLSIHSMPGSHCLLQLYPVNVNHFFLVFIHSMQYIHCLLQQKVQGINTVSCPIIIDRNSIERTVHTSFYCGLRLILCYQELFFKVFYKFQIYIICQSC